MRSLVVALGALGATLSTAHAQNYASCLQSGAFDGRYSPGAAPDTQYQGSSARASSSSNMLRNAANEVGTLRLRIRYTEPKDLQFLPDTTRFRSIT
jgi:hypothetical protein